MDNMGISGLFSSIDKAEDTEKSIQRVTDTGGNFVISSSDSSETAKKKKSPKQKKEKTYKYKIMHIKDEVENVKFTKLAPQIVFNTDILEVNIPVEYGDKPTENKYKTAKFSHSWHEFLMFLIGAIQFQVKEDFLDTIINLGIITNNIQIGTTEKVYLDAELDKDIQVYRMVDTPYIVEIVHSVDVFNSIRKCMKYLAIDPKYTTCSLYNTNVEVAEVAKELGEYGKNSIEKISVCSSLSDMIRDGYVDIYKVESVAINDEFMTCDSLRSGVILLIYFLLLEKEDIVAEALKSNTLKDVVGVTDDGQDYLGFIRVTPLGDSGLYFYYNGHTRPLLEYTSKVCEAAGVNPEDVYFSYQMELGGVEIG